MIDIGPHINIDISVETSCYILSGENAKLLNNSRLLFSLKRLNFEVSEDKIFIPYSELEKIRILQDIERLFLKYSITSELSPQTKIAVQSYDNETQTFKEFSGNAKAIRNDDFKNYPELVQNFKDFQEVVSQKLIRPLYPMQLLSSFHMAFSQNSCNFAVPGAGKTSIVYGAYAYLSSLGDEDIKHVDKMMVIGPISSFAPWEKEYEKCFGRKPTSQRLSGDVSINNKKEHLYSGNPSELTLIYHGGVVNLTKEIISFLKRNKTMVIVDEAHRIKNPEGVWGKSVVEIAKEARSRIILTGTPLPNGYQDLYNLFQFLYPYKFKEILKLHFNNLVQMSINSDPDSDLIKDFIDNIAPYFIRIKKSDLSLPPVNETVIPVIMGDEQRIIYDFIETKYMKSFEKNSDANVKDVLNKARLIRLRQAATNPALLLKSIEQTLEAEDYTTRTFASAKLPEEYQENSYIVELIKNYSMQEVPSKYIEIRKLLTDKINVSNNKVIIWTIFIQNAKSLQEYLRKSKIESELLIGEVEPVERESVIDRFNNPQNHDFHVVIANPFSVAESISLHMGCHNAIYLERDYNCSNFLQSKDRIHRYGLDPDQETNYYYLNSKESIDEVIDKKLTEKIKRMESIINEEIPLFTRLNENNESDLVAELMRDYASRTKQI